MKIFFISIVRYNKGGNIMKKYRVIGRNRDTLLNKTAEKLNVDIALIGYEIKSEEIKEDGSKIYTIDVWVKEKEEITPKAVKKVEEVKEVKKTEQSKKKEIEEIIQITIDNTGVYLQIEEKVSFNTVVDFIMEKEIKEPVFDSINEAFNNIGKKVKIAEYTEGVYEESKIEIEISENKMKAYVSITKPRGTNLPKVENVVKAAEDLGIVNGINKEIIKNIIDSKKFGEKILFAEGVEPVDGKSGYIKYNIKTAANKQKLKPMAEDGEKVDFKNLDIVENVKAGQVLAVKISPELGKKGIDILGNEIEAKDGFEIQIEAGKNTTISEDGINLIANTDGMVNMVGKRIDVLDVFVVEEVGLATGDIDFAGSVLVKNDVQADYNIKAEGNVIVNGNVESSSIYSDGDVTIKGACFGKEVGIINSKNDIILNFIESTKLEADGNIIVNEGIMNCNVTAGKKILLVDKKGTIVGGDLKAAEGIEAINIGSSRGIKTEIEVGVNPKVLEDIKKIELEIDENHKKMEQVEKNLNFLQEMKSSMGEKLPEDKEDMLKKMNIAKFTMAQKIKELEIELEDLKTAAGNIKNAVVSVHNICYAGVKIKIRKGSYTVKEPLVNVKFYYDNGEVKMTSLT